MGSKIAIVTTLTAAFILVSWPTAASDDAMIAEANQIVREMAPLRMCLKAEVSKAASQEKVAAVLENSCKEVEEQVRLKLRPIAARAPVKDKSEIDSLIDGSIHIAKISVFYEYTQQTAKDQKNR